MAWSDRWLEFRDRLTTSAGFRRWAAANPLTRPIARRRARALFDLCAGFVYSQILLACVRLRLFEALQEKPATPADLAHRLSLPPASAERLLRAASALGLCEERRGGRYGLGPLGVAMIHNPGVAAMVEHHALLYSDLRDPVALLRGPACRGALARYWPYEGRGEDAAIEPAAAAPYSDLMSASQGLVAAEVLGAYPLARHRRLLDVGGGDGTFALAAAAAVPALHITVFDLPAVAARASARIAQAGLTGRIAAVGGDVFRDALPEGCDVASLVRVLHDHDDAAALDILQAVRRALPAGGTLLIAEPMAGARAAEAVGDAYFGFYLLAMGRGHARTPSEMQQLLHKAGFNASRSIPTRLPVISSLVVAQIPSI